MEHQRQPRLRRGVVLRAVWQQTAGHHRVPRLDLQGRDGRSFAHLVTDRDVQGRHHAGNRRWDLHRGLVTFEGDQRLLGSHPVTGSHQQFDDIDALEL